MHNAAAGIALQDVVLDGYISAIGTDATARISRVVEQTVVLDGGVAGVIVYATTTTDGRVAFKGVAQDGQTA